MREEKEGEGGVRRSGTKEDGKEREREQREREERKSHEPGTVGSKSCHE